MANIGNETCVHKINIVSMAPANKMIVDISEMRFVAVWSVLVF